MNKVLMSNLKRAQEFLRKSMSLDDLDLDFGIYRLIRYKKHEVESFINDEFPTLIKNRMKEFSEEKSVLDLIKTMQDKDRVTEESKSSTNLEYLACLVLEHVITFLSRYHVEGDFMYQRRFGKQHEFVIPHDGKEITLYWVNKDQYHVKTMDSFSHYQFTFPNGLRVLFRTTWVEPTRDVDNKASRHRYYFLASPEENGPVRLREDGVLEIRFHYRTPRSEDKAVLGSRIRQDLINDLIVDVILEKCDQLSLELDKNMLKTTFQKHLRRYTKKNKRDFFIHKDLKGFLQRELDTYVKNEILNVDANLHAFITQKMIATLFKDITAKIIDFLARIEDFKLLLWEKKKFILDTQYIITVDRLASLVGDQRLEQEILPHVMENERQLQEWKLLFGEKITKPSDLRRVLETDKDKKHGWKPLPIDTQHFDPSFTWKLLSLISSSGHAIDDSLDGMVFQGENWQALNLLQEKFHQHVRTIYIDPPYNTGGDGFLYKDRFRHSSWLTMMADRLRVAKNLMAPGSVIFVSIDDNELYRLKLLMDEIFGESNYVETFLWTRTSTPPSLSKKSRTTTEYILCYERFFNPSLEYVGERTTKEGDQPLLNRGNPVRVLTFPPRVIRTNLPDGTYPPRKHDRTELLNEIIVKNGLIITECQLKGEFKWSQEFLNKEIANGTRFVIKSDKFAIRFIRPPDEGGFIPPNKKIKEKYVVELDKKKVGIDTNDVATRELRDLGVEFTNPKPVSLVKYLCRFITRENDYVLDFFAGSGTTGHAIMSLNEEEKTHRKFILVDMGDCIRDVVIPRLKKIAYSKKWKNGEPRFLTPDDVGPGLFLKYHSMETFEDTLENVTFSKNSSSERSLTSNHHSYMFYQETRNSPIFLDVSQLSNPFDYRIKTISDTGEVVARNVDLIETFNYLLGAWVTSVFHETWYGRNYVVVIGRTKHESVAIVWRTVENSTEFFVKDQEFIEQHVIQKFSPDVVYVNGDCAVKGARSIDVVFKTLLLPARLRDA